MKTYLPGVMDDRKLNFLIFGIALVCHLGSILCLNSVFLFASAEKEDQLLRFCVHSNPFILAMAISLFNMARSLRIQNKTLNTVAGLSMLVYILHGNILITGYMSYIIQFFYHIYGYGRILLTMVSTAVCVFLISAACAWLIHRFLNRYVRRFTDRMYLRIRCLAEKLEDRIMAIR